MVSYHMNFLQFLHSRVRVGGWDASVKGEKKIACKAQFLFTIVVECAHVMSIKRTSAWILLTLYSNGVSLKKLARLQPP